MTKFTAAFSLSKATKNTYKYEEQPEAGQPPRIGSLYIQKWALGAGTPPQALTINVSGQSDTNSKGKEMP